MIKDQGFKKKTYLGHQINFKSLEQFFPIISEGANVRR